MEQIVIYRKWKDTGEIIALFPEQKDDDATRYGMCGSYMHVGQHSDADYQVVIAATSPAEEHEYEDLHEELLGLGYELRVLTKKPIGV